MNTKIDFRQKLLISLTFSTLFYLGCYAQDSISWKRVHWGFKLNPTFGYMHVSGDPTITSDGLKLGFSFGVTGDYLINKHIALSTQLNISSINGGINVKTMVPNPAPTPAPDATPPPAFVLRDARTIYAVEYIELPIAFKFKTHTIGDGASFYAKIGIDPAFKLSSEGTATVSTAGVYSILGKTSVGDQLKSTRLGWLIGAGYDYRFSRDFTFTSGLVFNQGINNISRSNVEFKNSYLAIEFGVYF